MLNKKGSISWNFAVKLTLAIIAMGIITIVGYQFYILGSTENPACTSWITLQAAKKGATLNFLGIDIPPSGENGNIYTDNSPCITTREKIKEKDVNDQNDLHKKIADNMYYCWRQYGEGEIDFYSNLDFGSGNSYCRVCSDIYLDEDVKDQEIDIDEFEIFLSNEFTPNKKDKYIDFFLKGASDQIDFGTGKLKLTQNNHLYSMFSITKTAVRQENPNDITEEGLISAIPAAALTGGACYAGIVAGGKLGGLISLVSGGSLAPILVPGGSLLGCAIGMGGTLLTIAGDKVPTLILYNDDPEQFKNSCDSVIINLKDEKDFELFKNIEGK
ncbi:hypothetical protein CL617_00805 [archaeon]|nr:hypothetical protein [archaeon]|tara:strand:- start:298 stop:1284 length:987 start_codon:yes stop_codon:yes gene_type:complete